MTLDEIETGLRGRDCRGLAILRRDVRTLREVSPNAAP